MEMRSRILKAGDRAPFLGLSGLDGIIRWVEVGVVAAEVPGVEPLRNQGALVDGRAAAGRRDEYEFRAGERGLESHRRRRRRRRIVEKKGG